MSSATPAGRQPNEMPDRDKLVALASDLRHARTNHLPMEIAERVQHTIVRIEQMLATPGFDAAAADAVSREARRLLDECDDWKI